MEATWQNTYSPGKRGRIGMSALFLKCYIVVSVLIAAVDGYLAFIAFRKRTPQGFYLGAACVGAAVVDVSYLISILGDSYLLMSMMSSIYFVTIDIMLLCLLMFTVYFTKGKFTDVGKLVMRVCVCYTIFEILVFAINPFREVAVQYIPRDTVIARYAYDTVSYTHLTLPTKA